MPFNIPAVYVNMIVILLIVLCIVIIVMLLVSTCCCFCCYERGLRQAKKFNQENHLLQDAAHCQCHKIVTDKEHIYKKHCQPASKSSPETTHNQCHNNESDKEHSYEKPCPTTYKASEKNQTESAAYEEIRKKQFEGDDSQGIGEEVYLSMECQEYPLPSMRFEDQKSAQSSKGHMGSNVWQFFQRKFSRFFRR